MSLSIEQRVLRVLQHIHENPAADLSLDRLAELGLMSQIAASVGYPNIQSFTRSFSERYGVPPATFRIAGSPCPQLTHTLRGNFHMFKVEIEQVPQRRVAALLHQGAYSGIGRCFEKLSQTASSENLWPRTRGTISVCYDDPNVVNEDQLRSHAGLIIGDEQPLPDSLEDLTLEAGECAVLHYKGPYSALKVAYDYLYGDWLPKSGREPSAAPPYEIYLNDPATTEETQLLTDIVLKLTP